MKMAEPQLKLTPEQELYLDYAMDAQQHYYKAAIKFAAVGTSGAIAAMLHFADANIFAVFSALIAAYSSISGASDWRKGKFTEQKARGALAGISRDTLDEYL